MKCRRKWNKQSIRVPLQIPNFFLKIHYWNLSPSTK